MTRKILCIMWAGLALCGCASPGVTLHYYLLDEGSAGPVSAPVQGAAILLETPQLPAYLRQDGLVMQTAPHELRISRQHLWAQSPAEGIEAVLRSELNHRLQHYQVIGPHAPIAGEESYRLEVEVIHLLTGYDAVVRLEAQYWLTDNNGRALKSGHSRLQLAMEKDGYRHAVAQMRTLLSQLCQQIAADIEPD